MSAYGLGKLIEAYLEADDSGGGAAPSGGNGSAPSGGSASSAMDAAADIASRQQLQRLSQTTDKLSRDNKRLSRELDSLKSNMQMSALLPLLMNQQMTITQDLPFGTTTPVTGNGTALPGLVVGDSLTFAQSDMVLALLPALMMGGDDGGGGFGGGSNMMMMVALIALTQPSGGGSSNNLMLPLLLMAMMGQNQSSNSDSNSD
jgi:hypothetical protein